MKYAMKPTKKRRWPMRLTIVAVVILVFLAVVTVIARAIYLDNLKPVSMSENTKLVTVEEGSSLDMIAQQLEKDGLIKSAWAFKLYVSGQRVRGDLQAGTYAFSPSQNVKQIVAQLTKGKVAVDLVTILPGQRLDQIRASLINDGFSPEEVDAALNPANYAGNSALVDKPANANLEGYLYPDSFQRTQATTAQDIVTESLAAMEKQLTPDLRDAFAKQGLSTYQAIILASIVEKEVSKHSERELVAQVFLSRLRQGMSLGSDPTAFYGAVLAGKAPSTTYDSPYNTLLYKGLPPTPISNVSASSLEAVAHPATTEWLYFVSGDDGITRFSKTLQEHEALADQYCKKLCGRE